MKLTEDIIKELECALDMRGKDGNPIWEDGDDISVKVAGTFKNDKFIVIQNNTCLLYTSPSPRDRTRSRMPSSA